MTKQALAEAARCGFPKIVQILLDAGAHRDNANNLGWTALHEACFYNRIETVKVLLLAGADSTLRTRIGALPYHLSGLAVVRTMLEEMGGPGAVPEPGDEIDMVAVLQVCVQCTCRRVTWLRYHSSYSASQLSYTLAGWSIHAPSNHSSLLAHTVTHTSSCILAFYCIFSICYKKALIYLSNQSL